MKLFTFYLSFIFLSIVSFFSSLVIGDDSLKIGTMLCQTGNCADWGTAALKGARLASEEINSNGGVLSKKIALIVEDTSESISGAKAVSAFQGLLARNLKFYIGPSWAPGALAIAPIAARLRDIIVITPSASAPEFSRSAPHIFNMRLPEELATRALARYAFKQAGSIEVREVLDHLQNGQYQGAIGSFAFNEHREVIQAPVLFEVSDGKLVKLQDGSL